MIHVLADAGEQIRALISAGLAVEKVIGSQVRGEVRPRFDFQDGRELPAARHQSQHIVGERRHLRYCREIEHVTLIRALQTAVIARSTVKTAVARGGVGLAGVSGIAIP